MSEITELFRPLVIALGNEHKAEALRIIGEEEGGALAWGVQSGYLLWMRTHPEQVPTKAQIREWMKVK